MLVCIAYSLTISPCNSRAIPKSLSFTSPLLKIYKGTQTVTVDTVATHPITTTRKHT